MSKLLWVPATVNCATCRWLQVVPSIPSCCQESVAMPITKAYCQLWTATTSSSSELMSSCGLAGCLIAAEVAPPLSWQTVATEEKPLSETWLLMCSVWDCWQSRTPLTEFSTCITTQPIHLLLLPPCFPACRSSAERIGRRRRSRKWRDWKSLKGFKWRPTEHLKTRTTNWRCFLNSWGNEVICLFVCFGEWD